jgi:hypothetical protein
MYLMFNDLGRAEPTDVGGIKLGDRRIEIDVYGALLEVRAYGDDENSDLTPCARAEDVREQAPFWLRCSKAQWVASTPKEKNDRRRDPDS